jgi:hypothetical protein
LKEKLPCSSRSTIPPEFFDEMLRADGSPRDGARLLKERNEALPEGELLARQAAAAAERHHLQRL